MGHAGAALAETGTEATEGYKMADCTFVATSGKNPENMHFQEQGDGGAN